MPNFRAQVSGVYPLGSGQSVALPHLASLASSVLNTRDLGQPGAADFVGIGPGSQVWYLGYAIRAISPGGAPTNPLGLRLIVSGSLDASAPYSFIDFASILLPVWVADIAHEFSGRVRIEHTAALLTLANNTNTAQGLTVSFQFWGKAS